MVFCCYNFLLSFYDVNYFILEIIALLALWANSPPIIIKRSYLTPGKCYNFLYYSYQLTFIGWFQFCLCCLSLTRFLNFEFALVIIVRMKVDIIWHALLSSISSSAILNYSLKWVISLNNSETLRSISSLVKLCASDILYELYLSSLCRPWSYSSSISLKTFYICFNQFIVNYHS